MTFQIVCSSDAANLGGQAGPSKSARSLSSMTVTKRNNVNEESQGSRKVREQTDSWSNCLSGCHFASDPWVKQGIMVVASRMIWWCHLS